MLKMLTSTQHSAQSQAGKIHSLRPATFTQHPLKNTCQPILHAQPLGSIARVGVLSEATTTNCGLADCKSHLSRVRAGKAIPGRFSLLRFDSLDSCCRDAEEAMLVQAIQASLGGEAGDSPEPLPNGTHKQVRCLAL